MNDRARKGMCISAMSVPQTDTGRWEENSKANGRRVVKELGKITRNLGRRGAPARGPQRIGPGDCLAKTQVSAKPKGEV